MYLSLNVYCFNKIIDDLDMELMLDPSFGLLGWIVTDHENWWVLMVREKKKKVLDALSTSWRHALVNSISYLMLSSTLVTM